MIWGVVALQVNADDAGRIQELELLIAREDLALQGLRQQTQGLEVKATEIQRKIDGAGACVCEMWVCWGRPQTLPSCAPSCRRTSSPRH